MSLTIFAQRMKQAREKKNLKQNELAKAIGVTPTTISSYEKSDEEGNGKKPTLENAQAIAEKLEVSLDWLCGMSDSSTGTYANFSASDYLKSIVTILMETSTFLNTETSCICFENYDIQNFTQKISDLIKVYHNGSITDDLLNVCIEKIINDYSSYKVVGNCILDDLEYLDAEKNICDLINDDNIHSSMVEISVENHKKYLRDVELFISPQIIKSYSNKEVNDNAQHNPTQE